MNPFISVKAGLSGRSVRRTGKKTVTRSSAGIVVSAAIGAGWLLFFWMLMEPQLFHVKRYSVPNSSGETPVRIVFLSDFHIGHFSGPARLDRIVKKIKKIKPDVVILGGDYVDVYDTDYGFFLSELKSIDPPGGFIAVLGNHDYLYGSAAVLTYFRRSGIPVLENSVVKRTIKGRRVVFAGIPDYEWGCPDYGKIDPLINEEETVVFISHNPDFYYFNKDISDIDLGLAGHTHGGQITFFGLFAPYLNIRGGELFRHGLIEYCRYPVIVGSGLGVSNLPLRLFCVPEIVCVDF